MSIWAGGKLLFMGPTHPMVAAATTNNNNNEILIVSPLSVADYD